MRDRDRDGVSFVFIYGLGAAVAIVWMASVIASIVDRGYETPLALHGLMGTVVGSVFADVGLRRAQRRRDNQLSEDDNW